MGVPHLRLAAIALCALALTDGCGFFARIWFQTATSGDEPTGREDPIYFRDDSRNRLTFFSGRNDNAPEILFDDGYELDPVAGTWTRIDAGTQPPPRWRASTAIDPEGDRGYMFGGWRDFGGRDAFNDTWRYELGSRRWAQIVTD